jgi:SAP domain
VNAPPAGEERGIRLDELPSVEGSEPAPVTFSMPETAPEPEDKLAVYMGMKVSELKAIASERGLKVSGTKAVLAERLRDADEAAAPAPALAVPPAPPAVPPADEIDALDYEIEEISEEELLALEASEEELEDELGLSLGDGEAVDDVEMAADEVPGTVGASVAAAAVEDTVVGVDSAAAEGAAAAGGPDDAEAFAKMKVPELKDLLKASGLKVSGKKAQLIDRLVANGVGAPAGVV